MGAPGDSLLCRSPGESLVGEGGTLDLLFSLGDPQGETRTEFLSMVEWV